MFIVSIAPLQSYMNESRTNLPYGRFRRKFGGVSRISDDNQEMTFGRTLRLTTRTFC